MMEKIVVLSHEAGMSAGDLKNQINKLTNSNFTTTTDINKKSVMKYGCDTSATCVCLLIGDDNEWKLNTDNGPVKLTVSSVSYDKRIFKPGELKVTISCVNEDSNKSVVTSAVAKALKSALYDNKKTQRSIIYYLGCVKNENNKDELIAVCSKYYVHDFTINREDTKTKVVLNCFSPDNLLTLDKYSKVYCGDTFNGKLFKGMDNTPKELALDYDVKNLVNTKICSDDKKCTEIRFPFLMQYNESFYDFLRRIAVRCGEFLYYENGVLTLGIKEQTKPNTVFQTSGVDVRYPHVSLSETNGTKVNLVPSSSLTSEYIPKNNAQSYNMEYTNDDFQRVVDEEDNDKVYSAMFNFEKFTYGTLAATLKSATSPEAALTTMATGYLSALSDVGVNYGVLKGDFKDAAKEYADSVGLLEEKGGIKNSEYYMIEKYEDNAQKNTVELDYSSEIPNLFLGNAIDLNDGIAKFYTVTRIYGEATSSSLRTNMVEVVPATTKEKTTIEIVTEDGKKKFKRVTTYYYVPIPPHYDIPRIRKAEAQEAVVKDVKDPYLLGRVRVKFLWQAEPDTQEITTILNGKPETKIKTNFSPWLRITVPYVGGKSGGMNMMPEIDDHLMVNFVGGNVDMPYIEGFMATRATMPAMGAGLTKNKLSSSFQRKVIASSKGHAITFTDITDRSSILNILCPPLAGVLNMVEGFGKQVAGWTNPLPIDESWAPFSGGITLRDPNGVYELDLSAKTRSINVSSPFGNVNISAFTGITIDAPNGDVKIRGKNVSIEAGNNVTITSGSNIRNTGFNKEIAKATAISSIGTMAINVAKKAITAYLPWAKEVTKLTDLAFLRSSWEVMVRPVEGTLRLASKRNVIVTAGKGKVAIPRDTMSTALIKNEKGDYVPYNSLPPFVNIFKVAANAHIEEYDKFIQRLIAIQSLVVKISDIAKNIAGYMNDAGIAEYQPNNADDCKERISELIANNSKAKKWNEISNNPVPVLNANAANGNENVENEEAKAKYEKLVQIYNKALSSYNRLLDSTKEKYVYKMRLVINENTDNNTITNGFVDSLWDSDKMFGFDLKIHNAAVLTITPKDMTLNIVKVKRKFTVRKMLFNLLSKGARQYFTFSLPYDFDEEYISNYVWNQWIKTVKLKTPMEKMAGVVSPIGGLIDQLTLGTTNFAQYGFNDNAFVNSKLMKTFNTEGKAGPFSMWGTATKGQILVSNSDKHTVMLNDESDNWTFDVTSQKETPNIKAALRKF